MKKTVALISFWYAFPLGRWTGSVAARSRVRRFGTNEMRKVCSPLVHACALFSLVSCVTVQAEPTAPERNAAALTYDSLERLATVRPCAATAIYLFRAVDPSTTHGTFQMTGIPSAQSVAALDDELGLASETANITLLRNPYSSEPFYVEIQWVIARLGANELVVKTWAQIVDQDGMPLNPVHQLEPPTTILVAGKSFQLLGDSNSMGLVNR